jgi:hypothetical protein
MIAKVLLIEFKYKKSIHYMDLNIIEIDFRLILRKLIKNNKNFKDK